MEDRVAAVVIGGGRGLITQAHTHVIVGGDDGLVVCM